MGLGHKELRFALALISLSRVMSVPVYLENPGNSWASATPELLRLLSLSDAKVF